MEKELEGLVIPQHIAIIMDGNGRWAKKRFMPRKYGHAQGAKTIEKIIDAANDIGVKYLTVYAFSTENWVRPQDEVDALMKLLRDYLKDCVKKSKKNNMRVKVIGDVSRLDQDLQDSIANLEKESASNTGITFVVALNYGGRDEIVRATRKIAQDVKEGKLSEDQITDSHRRHHQGQARRCQGSVHPLLRHCFHHGPRREDQRPEAALIRFFYNFSIPAVL